MSRVIMLMQEIDSYINEVIYPFLRVNISRMLQTYESESQVALRFSDTPYMTAKVHNVSGNEYLVELSKGWITRLAILHALADEHWNSHEQRNKIYITSTESAFDSYIFRESVPPDFLFSRSQPLKYLFLDNFDESELNEIILDFPKFYRSTNSESKNLPFHLGLDFPDHFTKEAKSNLLISTTFLCCHEVAHTFERQTNWFKKRELDILMNEEPASFLEEEEHRLKAAEADADIAAINWTLNAFCNLKKSFEVEDIEKIFRSVFTFITSFDLGRQSIREYQGIIAKKSTHPIPDIRAVISMYGLFEGLNSGPNRIDHGTMNRIFDKSIEYVVKTMEAFAIGNCAYYILANPLVSFSHTFQSFTSKLSIALMMQDELWFIEKQLRKLRSSELEGKYFWSWRSLELDMKHEDFKKKCEEEARSILIDSKYKNQDLEGAYVKWMKEKRSTMNKGDYLIHLQHEFPDDIATNTSRYKMDDKYTSRALSIIFELANVKFKSVDTTD